jgi:hypothetical protein
LTLTLFGAYTGKKNDNFKIISAVGGRAGSFTDHFPTLGGGLTLKEIDNPNDVTLTVM